MNFFCEVFSFTPSPVFVQKSIALFAIALFRFIAKTDLFYLLCHEFLYYTSIVSYYRGFRHTKKNCRDSRAISFNYPQYRSIQSIDLCTLLNSLAWLSKGFCVVLFKIFAIDHITCMYAGYVRASIRFSCLFVRRVFFLNIFFYSLKK